jgi:hypothetical protein
MTTSDFYTNQMARRQRLGTAALRLTCAAPPADGCAHGPREA